MTADPCPCSSGLAYRACCAPYHQGALAPSCEALMRSRYAAFARKRVDYLLATSHPDLIAEEGGVEKFRRGLVASCNDHRYPGLTVLDHRQGDEEGQVLFRARVFRQGRDLTFAELSTFVREGHAWLYLSGLPVDLARLTPGVTLADLSAS